MKFQKRKIPRFLKSHGTTVGTFAGVVVGIVLGVLLRLRPEPWTQREVQAVLKTPHYSRNCIFVGRLENRGKMIIARLPYAILA